MILRRFLIFSYVGEMGKVIGILARPVDVADLMFADGFLLSGNHAFENQINETN